MDQYFSPENDALPSKRRTFFCQMGDKKFEFVTDNGVFSKSGLDHGSRMLLESIKDKVSGRILDLGCGYGPIGIILASLCETEAVLVDINPRAVTLAKENARKNQVDVSIVEGDGYEAVSGLFDWIITNPPVRAGKKVFYPWLQNANEHLAKDGNLVFVMKKDQGAPSAIKYLADFYQEIKVLNKKSGYYVINCKKCLTN